MRIDKVYTRGGDQGKTSLIGGDRVDKDVLRIECYGTIDELNACLGVAIETMPQTAQALLAPLRRVQNELFHVGCELATPDRAQAANMPHVAPQHVLTLENEIDAFNANLPALTSFVLPGGGLASAQLHVSRTVCRRAERCVTALARDADVGQTLAYLNRLSDALFVWSRYVAHAEAKPESLWNSRA